MVNELSSSEPINPSKRKSDVPYLKQKSNETSISESESSSSSATASSSSATEGSSFNGSSILSSTASPKRSKFKKVAAVLLSLKDKAEFALGIGTAIVDQSRAVNEIAQVFFEPCKVLGQILTPLRFLSWTSAPFVAFSFVNNGADFFTTPGWGKILPVMKSIVDVGLAAEMASNAAYLLEDIGVAAAQNVAVWAAPLGGVAIGLQSVAIAINGWGLVEVTNSLRRLKKAVDENIPGEGYAKAVELLTKKPQTRLEKFRAKFFKVLTNKQEARIARIHEKVMEGEIDESKLKKALGEVSHRFHLKQFGYALAITASVAGIIGVAILIFGPTPIAPVGWFFVGMSATTSLTLVGLNIYARKRLDLALKHIDPEPLPDEKPSFFKRSFKWIHTKFKRRQDGSFEQVSDSS